MRLYSNEDIGLDKTRTCCSLNDVEDARFVAFKLGIDFHVFNFSDDFKHYVIDNFVDTYLAGGTPNPCIECNKHLKFAKFYERAKLLGFDHIATGHYATREFDEKAGRWLLKRSPDRSKDQSYVLYSMTQEQLAHTLFPVGEMHKDKIRDIAEENKLINADKPDSQDICFIPDGDYAGFITKRCGEQQSGDIVLSDGTKLGKHKGLIHYTIGQRKGVGISYSEPLFVVTKDMEHNRLIMGKADEVYSDNLVAGDVNFIPFDTLTATVPVSAVEPVALVKLRHVNVHITHKGGHCNSLVLGVYGNYHHNISISTALLFCITDILANEQNVCYVLAGYLGGLLL